MTNYIGNLSTIIKWFSMMIAGSVIGTLTAHGLNLNVDATTLSEVIGAFILLIIGYIDARFPNTFNFLGLGNNNVNDPVATESQILNDEYVTGDEDDI